MAGVDGIKVTGLNEAIRALEAIGTPRAEVQAASQRAGEIVASMSRSLVPVKSGKLRATIKAKKQARKVLVSAGNNSSVPYANPIHWGWYYDKNNFVKKNIMPNPFFAKALGYTRQEVYENYFNSINNLFNRYSKTMKR